MGALPLIVWPDIKVSDAAVLQTELPANGLEFRNAADVNVVKVVAENKTVKTWQIGIRELALPKIQRPLWSRWRRQIKRILLYSLS